MSEKKESLGSLIPMMGILQDILSTLPKKCKIDIPQIVVMGDQSVGKSSTLEAIVGKDFLPRGEGMVTRCPILLHLVHSVGKSSTLEAIVGKDFLPRGEGMVTRCPILLHLVHVPEDDLKRREHLPEEIRSEDWATFKGSESNDSKAFTNFEEVRKEIKAKTDAICEKGVSSTVINLKIFSSKVIELTLVDLPGLTSVAVEGQRENVPKDIEQLVKTYIEKKNCIILVVTQATQDFNTSLSLKLAKEVDPQHSRTLCVLTKIDTLKEPSNAKKILSGEIIKFKHGIIGVVNRSISDVEKPMQTCLDDEKTFFNEKFHRIAQMHGIYYLRVKLNKLLERHIKDCLPKFREEFDREIAEQQKLFDSYGSPITEENKHRVMNESIADFCNIYKSRLSGTASEVNKCSTGAQIRQLFDKYRKELNNIDPSSKITDFDKKLSLSIQNASGINSNIFMIEGSYNFFFKEYLSLLTTPSHECAKRTFDLLKNMGNDAQKKIERFPEFESFISSSYSVYLEQRLKATNQIIDYLIEIQSTMINESCIHKGFEDFSKKCSEANKEFKQDEKGMVNLTRQLLHNNFVHVREILQDVIPKAIMTSLIYHVKDQFKKDFEETTRGDLDKHFVEDESITLYRAQTKETLEKLWASRQALD
uniref:Uncharacterized protein n=1 Tax=Panagrolaimus sp. ES5 TaxID=591445 RepID=A0AC34FEQ6_9BILA